jgi:hypothetical protein
MTEDVTKLKIETEHIEYIVNACNAEEAFTEILDSDKRDKAELAELDALEDTLRVSLEQLVGYTGDFFAGLRHTHAWIQGRIEYLENEFSSEEEEVEGA